MSRNSAATFESAPPKRTRIGSGRRVRTNRNQGRVKRSSPEKRYRGQGR
jgi:hypothetical protein